MYKIYIIASLGFWTKTNLFLMGYLVCNIKITILQIQDAKKSLPEEPAHQRNSSKTHIKNMPTLKTTILVCV